MQRARLRDHLRYAFDNSMSRGPVALIGWLAVVSVAVILAVSLVVLVAGIAPEGISPTGESSVRPGLVDLMWYGLMRTLDAGTMGGDSGSWPFLVAMLVITLAGVFIVSTLIGVLTSGIEGKLEELRKGRSRVLERDHTLILGWSPKIFPIISELVIANANRRRPRIVVLADRDKVEMEDEIRAKVGDTGATRVICRTGSPIDLGDLDIVSPQQARSIIALADGEDDPDSHVIKVLLAVTNSPTRRPEPYHIVAEISDPKNLEVARMVGRDEAQIVVTGDLIARIVVQTCRQSGLSVVLTELLDFGGDEIYVQVEPTLVGRSFGDALLAYEDSSVFGLRRADGSCLINPPMDTTIGAGDAVIAVSEDDDTVRVSGKVTDWARAGEQLGIDDSAIRSPAPRPPQPERTLILGWNRGGATIVNELDCYVAPGSTVTVVAEDDQLGEELARSCSELAQLQIEVRKADITDRRVLDRLDVTSFDQVVLLSEAGHEVQQADARTLVTLLHLRDIADRSGRRVRIVSEMLDVRNRELAEVTRADDFIVSSRLVSLLLTQVSENRDLATVFGDLFDPEGSEIYIRPAEDYVELGRPVSFYTVVESARRRGQVAIGYRILADAARADRAYGVVTNPRKSEMVRFTAGDRVVVVAED